jgi:hypothetical protein
MSLYAEVSPGVFERWTGQPINGTKYPPNWSKEELIEFGLFEPVRPAVPTGKRVVSETVQRVAGVVKFIYTLEDLSEDELYPPLEKWKFWAIIELAGLKPALLAAIDSIPDATFKVIAKAKLEDPAGGVYNRSDPLFHNPYLQMQLKLTDVEIDDLWLQASEL